ncbi:AAA family ATPase [Caloranaerobacter azorensis]|uniref:AAA family ATPase n=1 Tax=Caloranaerobacter azorensis TaxID=116090 RepID=A0A6P1YD40_9FIRM|nr:AAA family ATPase [Caloranaerobacter azorensis]QIB26822.1 AAA family ATPase [Caloranaerobacter azorensis]
MVIRELILNSFGKFKNKSITFTEGINIVFGKNESGKTTIHKFIEGMFYGFFKPYTKRKNYTEDYNKYFPWNDSEFSGILKYSCDGVLYRIERNFLKGKEEVKIFDDETGEDLTYLFEYDNAKKLHIPASLHIGLNKVVYNNTISISQMQNKTDKHLAKEIKDSLINLGGSLDEDISVKKVIDKLDKKINDIGTKARVKTSPYGKLVEELDRLYKERRKSESVLEEIRQYQIQLNSIKEEIKKLVSKKEKIENDIEKIKTYKARERYSDAVKLIEQINELKEEAERLKAYSIINPDDFTETVKLKNSIDEINFSLNKSENKKKKLIEAINDIRDKIDRFSNFGSIKNIDEIDNILSDFFVLQGKREKLIEINNKILDISNMKETIKETNIDKMEEDLYRIEELEDEKGSIKYNSEYGKISFLRLRLEEKEKQLNKLKTYKILSIIGIILSLPLGFYIKPIFFLTSLIPLIFFILMLIKHKELSNYLNNIKINIADIEKKEREREHRINIIDKEIEDILNRYNVSNKVDLKKLISNSTKELMSIEDKENLLKELKSQKLILESEVDKLKNIIERYLSQIGFAHEVNLENIKKLKKEFLDYIEYKRHFVLVNEDMNAVNNEINELRNRIKEFSLQLNEKLENNKVKNIDEFKIALEKKAEFEKVMHELENKKSLLNSVLGDNNLQYLKKRAELKLDYDISKIKSKDIKRLEEDAISIRQQIAAKKELYARLEEKIKGLTLSSRPIVDIDEEIDRKVKLKKYYEEKLEALELAKNTIERISREIHKEFAPKLNRKVGEIISNVTQGRYTDVKATEELNIMVVDPMSKKLVDIESLSGGTIDQLFFAIRFGIIDIIKEGKNLPLILDDCFIQYDNDRLKNILEFLVKESLNRQIILFTCHTREKDILDELKVNYNYIDIKV